MAVNERTFVRILPESTGDRIGFYHTWDIEYSNKIGSFNVGDIVVGSSSGTKAFVIKDTIDNTVSTSGVLSTLLLEGFEGKTHTVGETLNVLGSPQSTVDDSYCVYINTTTLVGGNNPKNQQFIDEYGAAYTRFAEGAPTLDSFGSTRVTNRNMLGEYVHQYNELPKEWNNDVVGSGSVTHLPNESAIKLSVGTSNGDKITRTTNKYHRYLAGQSQLINFTFASGDTGKSNVRREWGYGDDENGVFFRLDGTTLSTLLRSKVTGSIVETVVDQTDWNVDRLDGGSDSRNASTFNIDVSKLNIYWIDLQWLGSGRIRFGVYSENGSRITCHQMENSNINNSTYMTTATLPLRVSIENTGIAASTSEARMVCATVFTEGEQRAEHDTWHKMHTVDIPQLSTSTTAQEGFSIRSASTLNGITNRVGSVPELISAYVGTEPVMMKVVKNAILTTPTWTINNSAIDIDTARSGFSGGEEYLTLFLDVGVNNEDIDEHFGYLGEYLRLLANGSYGDTYTFTFKTFAATGTIDMSFTWFDHVGV